MTGPVVVVSFDRVYGKVVCRPENDAARTLASIAGTRTLLPATLQKARALGCVVELAPGSWQVLEAFVSGAA